MAKFQLHKHRASFCGAGENRWKDEGRFFNKGANGQWRADLSAEDLAIYDTRIRDMLPARDVDWLESGNG